MADKINRPLAKRAQRQQQQPDQRLVTFRGRITTLDLWCRCRGGGLSVLDCFLRQYL